MYKVFYKVYNANENPFQWLTLGPTAIVALFGFYWIIFLFPEWKRNLHLVIFLLLSVLIVSGGVYSFLFGVLNARKVNWQIISGTIVSSYIQKERAWESSVDDRSVNGTQTVTYYVPYVDCKYTILGKEYANAMIAGAGTDSRDEAQSVLNQFPVGKKIDCFYDPKYPDKAVINIPPVFARMLPLIVGLLLIPAGLFIGWVIMVVLYNNGKTLDVSEVFKIPIRLEYQVNRAAVKMFKFPEPEIQKLASYMDYLHSINDYISKYNCRYTKFYTQERVLSEQIKTLERLIEIPQHDPWQLFNYGEDLYNILYRADRLSDARLVLEKIRDKYPDQFNASDLKNKLALEK